MSELQILLKLTGNEYKIYRYLVLLSNNNILHGITREQIEKDCNIGYTTVYKSLKVLQDLKLIEYRGNQKFVKILPVD